ncbi:hypothetical protein F4703DRAFT_1920309 [Phycomyces blakesleeanus]
MCQLFSKSASQTISVFLLCMRRVGWMGVGVVWMGGVVGVVGVGGVSGQCEWVVRVGGPCGWSVWVVRVSSQCDKVLTFMAHANDERLTSRDFLLGGVRLV